MRGILRFLIPWAGSGVAGGSRDFGVGRKAGGETLRTSDNLRRPQGDTNLLRIGDARKPIESSAVEAVTSAVLGAQYLPRESNDDGTRCAVISPSLGGAFFFDREEAARRIGNNFPALDEKQLCRAVALMQSRVRLALNPVEKARKGGWVNAWRDSRHPLPWE